MATKVINYIGDAMLKPLNIIKILLMTIFLGGAVSIWASEAEQVPVVVKKAVIDLKNEVHQRPVKVNFWHLPSDQCKTPSHDETYCLAEKVKLDHVVVLSHGAFGSANEYEWIAQVLASEGHLVFGLSHYQESWIYGQHTIDRSSVTRLWQRAQDVQFILNELPKKLSFNKNVDWKNVIALGHSSGGMTSLILAGATYDFQLITEYCQDKEKSKGDIGCKYGEDLNGEPSKEWAEKFRASYVDPRIKMVIALDPALGSGVVAESLKKIKLPVLIVAPKNNDFLPFEHHGAWYAKHLPNAKLIALDKNQGHFIFLDPCNHGYSAQGVSLCKDRPGVDRAAEHKEIAKEIVEFIKSTK